MPAAIASLTSCMASSRYKIGEAGGSREEPGKKGRGRWGES